MSFRIDGILDIHFQGLNLNCGRYCLEAVMRWKHGSAYGIDASGVKREAHTKDVQAHIDTRFKTGFDPGDYKLDYNLAKIPTPDTAPVWEAFLRKYGPIIASGHIGAVRIIPDNDKGHWVVVIGVNEKGKIEYYDPLRPLHAVGGAPATLSADKFLELADKDVYYCMSTPRI
jgi:hypothetical protein